MTTPTDTTTHPGSATERISGLWSFTGRYRTLHLTWFAFFLSFVVWFNFAPFSTTIQQQLGLTSSEIATIGLANIALTVPARVFVGMALDRWGPRQVYSSILIFAVVPNTIFAFSNSLSMLLLSRLALSVVGAGFVVGIRLVAEWFPPSEVGTAEGVYGGWGNFGSAFASFTLPTAATALAFVAGDENGWRWAIFTVGVIAALYGMAFRRMVTDTPDGVTFARPKRQGALEVTTRPAVFGLAALTVPINAVLAVIAWRIWRVDVIGDTTLAVVLVGVLALTMVQVAMVFRTNQPALRGEYPESDQYPFRSVAVLCLAYFATFGSELAVVTMLPGFFESTWALSATAAGAAASAFAFTNLIARPAGGLLSDVLGSRKRTLGVLLAGLAVGYGLVGSMGSAWPVFLAIAAVMLCSVFVQAGEGAVFAIVPLVKKRVSGQVAGLAGASGNVGAVTFLTARLLMLDHANADPNDAFTVATAERYFFAVIAITAVLAWCAHFFLVEPANSFGNTLLTDEADAIDTPRLDVSDPTIDMGAPELTGATVPGEPAPV